MNSGHVLSIDTAYGVRRNSSYSVIQEWQRDSTGNHYLLDKWSDRVTYPDLRRKTLSFVKRRRVSVILVEDTAGGNALVSDLRQRLPQEISVHGIVPLASKRERLRAVMDLVRGGLVFLPKSADWLEDFLQQLDE